MTPDQRKALRALVSAPPIWAYHDIQVLVGEYGLPDDEESLRAYTGA